MDVGRAGPIACVGDIILDRTIRVTAPRAAGGSRTIIAEDTYVGGGATNMAVILAQIGVPVRLYGFVGTDFGDSRLAWLRDNGVDVTGVRELKGPTLRAYVFYSAGEASAYMDTRLASAIRKQSLEHVPTHCGCLALVGGGDTGLQKHFVSLLGRRGRHSRIVYFDPGPTIACFRKNMLIALLQGADYVKLNESEWDYIRLQQQTGRLKAVKNLLQTLVVTRGAAGADIISAVSSFSVPALPGVRQASPVGAGDAFNAGFVTGILLGGTSGQAAEIGCLIASRVVRRRAPNTALDRRALFRKMRAILGSNRVAPDTNTESE